MNNLVKIEDKDPVLERYISSNDKLSIKKTLAFEYFNNDVDALNQYINFHVFKANTSEMIEPKAQLEFSF
tara:strand:- start:63 stop:272 length:210 start_codon:yes stop_codon:yes gene_type:complete